MPDPLSIRCPDCRVKLKVHDASKLGQTVKCPKCGHEFAARSIGGPSTASIPIPVQTKAELENSIAASGGVLRRTRFQGSETESEEPSVPLATRLGDNAIIYAAGGALALAFVVCLIVSIAGDSGTSVTANTVRISRSSTVEPARLNVSTNSPGPQSAPAPRSAAEVEMPAANLPIPTRALDLTWLPPRADLVLYWRPAELRQLPALAPFLASREIEALTDAWHELTGVAPGEIESITLGASGVFSAVTLEPVPMNELASRPASGDGIAVVRLGRSVDAGALPFEAKGLIVIEHRGQKYYRGPALAWGGERLGVAVQGRSLVLLGSEPALRLALERGAQTPERPDLRFVDAQPPFVAAIASKGLSRLWRMASVAVPVAAPANSAQPGVEPNPSAVSLSLATGQSPKIEIALAGLDDAAARIMRQSIEASLRGAQAGAAEGAGAAPPNVRFFHQGDVLRITSDIPLATVAALASLKGSFVGLAGVRPDECRLFVDESRRRDARPQGLPEGIAAQAYVRWPRAGQSAGTGRPGPEVVVELAGASVASTAGYEACVVSRVRSDADAPLQYLGPATDPAKPQYTRIDRGEAPAAPSDKVQLVLPFARPGKIPASIAELEGTVTLHVAREIRPVVITSAIMLLGRSLNNSQLKATRLTCTIERAGDRLVFRARGGRTFQIAAVQPIDGNGRPLTGVTCERKEEPGEVTFGVLLSEKVPVSVGFAIAVCSGVREVKVPLSFENLEVPALWQPRSSQAGGANLD